MSHSVAKDDLTFEYVEETIAQSLVQDFTNRIKAIQQEGGITVQTHNRAAGDKVAKSQTLQIYDDIIYTKNNIANLSGATLRTYSNSNAGHVMDNDYLIATIEKNIGILEGFCVSFTKTCSTHKSSNCISRDGTCPSNTTCSGNDAANFSTHNASNFSAYHTGNFATHNSANFSVTHDGFRSSHKDTNRVHFFSSVRSPNDPFNYMHFHSGRSGCNGQKVHVHSSQNKTFHHVRHSSNFATHNNANYANTNATHKGSHNSANRSSHKASNLVIGNSANRSGYFNANKSGREAKNATNFSGVTVSFAANFSVHADTCMVVHSTYQVEGIDFTHTSGE